MAWAGEARDADMMQATLRCDYGCGHRVTKVLRIEPSRELLLLCTRHYGLAKCNLSAVLARRAGWPKETARMRRRVRRAHLQPGTAGT
jgi:hypothetical protein